jgi:hypothetical protein
VEVIGKRRGLVRKRSFGRPRILVDGTGSA